MVMDVESVGLHGEGFAVAALVLDCVDRVVLASNLLACDPAVARGDAVGRQWVATHVPALPQNCADPQELRAQFWQHWLHWRAKGCVLVADSAWPVEANFVSACVLDAGDASAFAGPQPIIDVDALAWMCPAAALGNLQRDGDELPAHHPLADARFTARRLWHWQDWYARVA